jgi:adenosylhomocysteine nucleosidase
VLRKLRSLAVLGLWLAPFVARAAQLPVLVIVGMDSEAKIAAGPGALVISSAGNGPLLRSRLKGITHDKVRAVISFGIAGALEPSLQPGDLLVGGRVVSDEMSWSADPELSKFITARAKAAGINAKDGVVLGHDGIQAVDPKSRAALRAQTKADLVDEESHIAAEFAKSENLPFSLIRAVADPASSTLAPAATLPLNPDGTPDTGSVIGSLFKNPGQIGGLLEVKHDMDAALATLTAVRAKLDWTEAR